MPCATYRLSLSTIWARRPTHSPSIYNPPEGTTPDASTLDEWLSAQSEIWAQITADPIPAKQGIETFASFVRALRGRRLFIGHPLTFDGHWVGHNMQQYLGQGLVPFHGAIDPLLFGAGIDLPSSSEH